MDFAVRLQKVAELVEVSGHLPNSRGTTRRDTKTKPLLPRSALAWLSVSARERERESERACLEWDFIAETTGFQSVPAVQNLGSGFLYATAGHRLQEKIRKIQILPNFRFSTARLLTPWHDNLSVS